MKKRPINRHESGHFPANRQQGKIHLPILLVLAVVLLAAGAGGLYLAGIIGFPEPEQVSIDGVLLVKDDSPEYKVLSILSTVDSKTAEKQTTTAEMQTTTAEMQTTTAEKPQDWAKQQSALEKQVDAFHDALSSGRVSRVVKMFSEPVQAYYEELFTEQKEQMDRFAELFASGELVFLSPETDPGSNTFGRVAEYAYTHDGMVFTVVFILEDGKWKILNL